MRESQAPHCGDSERAVLGSLLLTGGNVFDRVGDMLADTDFFIKAHQTLYRVIGTLVRQGNPADVVTVSARLETLGNLRATGGREYLEELMRATPSAANIRKYSETIIERRMKRQLIDAANRMAELAYEPGDVRAQLDEAQSLVMHLADSSNVEDEPRSMSQVVSETVSWIESRIDADSPLAGTSWGFRDMDRKTAGMHGGDLIIVAGRPGMGKTALAMNVAENVSMGVTSLVDARGVPIATQGAPVLVFSLEMSRLQLGLRSIASTGRVDLGLLRSPANLKSQSDWDKVTTAVTKLHNSNLWVDEKGSISVSQMHSRARRFQRQNGLALIVVDYLQLMSGSAAAAKRGRVEELSEITRGLKQMAKDLGVPVMALSQLSRAVESRANKRPTLADLRESGSIEQDADAVIFVYRDDYYHPDSQYKGLAEAIIAKQRMGETGHVGFAFNGAQSSFSDYTGRLPDLDAAPDQQSRQFNGKGGGFSYAPRDD